MAKKDGMKLLFIVLVIGALVYLLNTGRISLPNEGTLGGATTALDSMVPSNKPNYPGYIDMTKNNDNLTGQSVPSNMNQQQSKIMAGLNNDTCYPRPQLSAEELLPKDSATEWASVNPGGVGSLCDKNFLQAGAMIGIDTVGQTLRNPNLQIRSEPIIPQRVVSPWLQSTIAADLVRRPLEIGSVPLDCASAEWADK